MYAAVATSTQTGTQTGYGRMGPGNIEDLTATLSGKVSTEAITALQTLMTKHKTEMEALKSSTTTLDKTAMQAKREAFKTEMDALMTKYPDLKTAMPAMGKGMGGRDGGNKEMDTIIATLSAETQAELEAIHDEYKTKQENLRTEESAKIDAVLIKYPEVKAKIDALKKTRQSERQGGPRGDRMRSQTSTTTAE